MKKNEHSPPDQHTDTSMDQVMETFNEVMKPLMQTWTSLSNDPFKESVATFLVVTEQHRMILTSLRRPNPTGALPGTLCPLVDSDESVNEAPPVEPLFNPNQQECLAVAKTLLAALDGSHVFGQRILPLIRKGGDEVKERDDMVTDYLHAFYNEFPEFKDEHAVTAFKSYDKYPSIEEPLMRFQVPGSRVCAWVAVFNHLLYSKLRARTSMTNYNDAISSFATNVSRFMRNTFPPYDLFDYIFAGSGAWPYPRLVRLLKPWNLNVHSSDLVHLIRLDEDLEVIYLLIEGAIRRNASLVIERFQQFREFEDPHVLVHSGDFRNMTPMNIFHSLLIVGSRRTNNGEMGGMKLWLQDSEEKKPFAVVGLDLLLSMESVHRLLSVPSHLSYTATCPLQGKTAVVTSGMSSPGKRDDGNQFFSSEQICSERREDYTTPTAASTLPSDHYARALLDPKNRIPVTLGGKKKTIIYT